MGWCRWWSRSRRTTRPTGTADQSLLCLPSFGLVCVAAGRPPRPGELNQCWIWRWCPNALWGTSNGNSRWVSLGSYFRTLLCLLLPSRPFLFLVSAPYFPAPAASRLFGLRALSYPFLPARPASLSLILALTPSLQASEELLLGQWYSRNNNNNGRHSPDTYQGQTLLLCVIISSMPPWGLSVRPVVFPNSI